jgi:predicted Fe-S protein YdhL (DUF1289 family)|tara:strand:+ start:548 stop:946 length:399 start_codon:yes stop_codon:yes gene_type:complete
MSNLSQIIGESTSLSDSPCIGRCSTTWGDVICKGCGRSEKQIRDWHSYTSLEKKLINLSLSKKFFLKNMDERKKSLEEIEKKIFSAKCLVEMIGADLLDICGKDPKIKNTYQELYKAVKSLEKGKDDLPVDI